MSILKSPDSLTYSKAKTAGASIIHVDQNHPATSDTNDGSKGRPFQTINRAAALAKPGDTVLVYPGVYRERVSPASSGLEGKPVIYKAQQKGSVFLRGSDVFDAEWSLLSESQHVYRARMDASSMGAKRYGGFCDASLYADFNPFHLSFNRRLAARPHSRVIAEQTDVVVNFEKVLAEDSSGTGQAGKVKKLRAAEADLARLQDLKDPKMLKTLGQIFFNGSPLREVEQLSHLEQIPGTWMMDAEGEYIQIHLPSHAQPSDSDLFEISVRHTVFSPMQRRLNHIHVEDFVIEHGANYCPSWGPNGCPQAGLLSCRSGSHWVIRGNTIRYANALGIDIGQEGYPNPQIECADQAEIDAGIGFKEAMNPELGHHLIEDNDIVDNGFCGLAGIYSHGVRIINNRVERNNADGWTSPWWEFGGIKVHFFYDGLIEGNLVRDNDAHGIWIDNQYRGSRVTRNVILNNLWSGINVELARGPLTIDNNVIALTRRGDGIYGHDTSENLIAHNLLYANAGYGVWFAYCTPRVAAEDACWDHRILNNMILANSSGPVGLPLPWLAGGNNVSDYNLIMGTGPYLDEGSGPQSPQFMITNKSHCAPFAHVCPGDQPQTPEQVTSDMLSALKSCGDPALLTGFNEENFSKHFMLSLEQWRAAMHCDQNSLVISVIRDCLSSHGRLLNMDLPSEAKAFTVPRIDSIETDFYQSPLDAQLVRPGPFQDWDGGEIVF